MPKENTDGVTHYKEEYFVVKADMTERQFETDAERKLIKCGWVKSTNEGYDRVAAIKVDSLVAFVKETQPNAWGKLEGYYGDQAEYELVKRLCKELKPHGKQGGALNALRHGIQVIPAGKIQLCFFRPSSGMNLAAEELYSKNRFEVVRQLRYGTLKNVNEDDSVDMVLFLNGIPVACLELKNNLSGQYIADAEVQWREDRSPRETLFMPNHRSLVYFAVDNDNASMVTWLNGSRTSRFLPFNKGTKDNGAGNPANPDGYRTDYLFLEVLAPDSLLEIVQKYVRIEFGDDEKTGRDKMDKIIFPRYHQLDCVRKVVEDVREHGSGKNYLIQHSAGSGKSNSISWIAYQLSSLHNADDENVFDSVIVVTDRLVLDQQLQDNIESIDHKRGVVKCISNKMHSSDLRAAINGRDKIIVTTIQKFLSIYQDTDVRQRKFAVIIDEAHSSQSGSSHAKMKQALTDVRDVSEDEMERLLAQAAEEEQAEAVAEPSDHDRLDAELAAQGQLDNISFFAFTATPKPATLDVFGTRGEDDKPHPFHLYSMKQAIEEGFILDVLTDYTMFSTYFQLTKKVTDDPKLESAKTNKALMGLVKLHPANIAKKAEIIIEHFRENVMEDLKGEAKAMVVTSSRLAAVKYYHAFKAYIERMGYANLGVLVAFSGTVKTEGREVREQDLNSFPQTQTAKQFDSNEYRILIAANKFQTGFDQPKLEAMYVDKMLSGITAVQTLSRLNRCYDGKRTFILDFVNEAETIQAAFSTYYLDAEIDKVSDPHVVFDIKDRLDGYHVYLYSEVEQIGKIYYKDNNPEKTLAHVEGIISAAKDRFDALDDQKQFEFRDLCRKFRRVYAQVTQMIALNDRELHVFNVYINYLLKKIPPQRGEVVDVRDKVDLTMLEIRKAGSGSISISDSQEMRNSAGTAGVKPDKQYDRLSEIIAKLNEMFGTEFGPAAVKLLEAGKDKLINDKKVRLQAQNNSIEDFRSSFGKAYENMLGDLMEESSEFFDLISKRDDATSLIGKMLCALVYDECQEKKGE
ncbi:MAG: DEAD/DEAH box helicase family protein [Gordonibacter sp.]|nr:DEAD/DEAH box helicase family protein [Gordonibacter sp.]